MSIVPVVDVMTTSGLDSLWKWKEAKAGKEMQSRSMDGRLVIGRRSKNAAVETKLSPTLNNNIVHPR